MSHKWIIQGGRPLSGDYAVQGNKNAALPLISAAFLSPLPVLFHNVPRIGDLENLLSIVKSLGVRVEWQDSNLLVDAGGLRPEEPLPSSVEKLRGSILLLGALAERAGRITSSFPGGCPIGRRSFDVHWDVFRAAGFSVEETAESFQIQRVKQVGHPEIYLGESSVTATENALLLLCSRGGGTIHNPAREPHVLCLVEFLRILGCEIELRPVHFRVRRGPAKPKQRFEFEIPPDYVDAGTTAIAAAVTGGSVRLRGINLGQLRGVFPVLERFGLNFRPLDDRSLEVTCTSRRNPPRVVAGPWPAFPTDLMSLAIVLATQSSGTCLLHDWMYEARMFFIDKLVRMGARITMCDPHRVLVEGPTALRGINLESPDIRAGMALVVAGLCAQGTTTIEHAEVISRGYEKVTERLCSLGAEIQSHQ